MEVARRAQAKLVRLQEDLVVAKAPTPTPTLASPHLSETRPNPHLLLPPRHRKPRKKPKPTKLRPDVSWITHREDGPPANNGPGSTQLCAGRVPRKLRAFSIDLVLPEFCPKEKEMPAENEIIGEGPCKASQQEPRVW